MNGQLEFEGMTQPQADRAEALVDWWMEQAAAEAKAIVPKAVEYGAADLQVMGEAMLLLMPEEATEGLTHERRSAIGQEVAVAFYALGKVARLFGAYTQGRLPSDDTWYDLGVYARMGRRIRETGGWA